MNREIKFRAWSKHHKKMYDNVTYTEQEVTDCDPWEFMQFTGLKDKNGKEIYEGDIVEIDERLPRDMFGGTIQPITYLRGQFYANKNCENLAGLSVLASMGGETVRCEVIGDIYENPELLTPHKELANKDNE